jgi:hypothetical protein
MPYSLSAQLGRPAANQVVVADPGTQALRVSGEVIGENTNAIYLAVGACAEEPAHYGDMENHFYLSLTNCDQVSLQRIAPGRVTFQAYFAEIAVGCPLDSEPYWIGLIEKSVGNPDDTDNFNAIIGPLPVVAA